MIYYIFTGLRQLCAAVVPRAVAKSQLIWSYGNWKSSRHKTRFFNVLVVDLT